MIHLFSVGFRELSKEKCLSSQNRSGDSSITLFSGTRFSFSSRRSILMKLRSPSEKKLEESSRPSLKSLDQQDQKELQIRSVRFF